MLSLKNKNKIILKANDQYVAKVRLQFSLLAGNILCIIDICNFFGNFSTFFVAIFTFWIWIQEVSYNVDPDQGILKTVKNVHHWLIYLCCAGKLF